MEILKREICLAIVVMMISTALWTFSPAVFATSGVITEIYVSDDAGATLAMDDAINTTTVQPHYGPTEWQPAVYVWGPSNGSGDAWNHLLHPGDYKAELLAGGVNWIWKPMDNSGLLLPDGRTVYNITNEEAFTGDIVKFKRSFEIPFNALNLKGTLLMAADNGFYMYVNKDFTGAPIVQGNFCDDYNYTNFRDPATGFPIEGSVELPNTPPYPWSMIHLIDVSSELVAGVNTLEIVAINEYGPPSNPSTPEYNPAGIIYKLTVEYELPPPKVIPEVPVGTILASTMMIIALAAYVAVRKWRRKQEYVNL